MAENNGAVLTPATGYIFTAATGTEAPTLADVNAFDPALGITSGVTPVSWVSIGHTAREELPVFGYEGGETEVKGTWQNASFAEIVTEVAADYVTFNAHQFDNDVLSMFYGVTGSPGSTVGRFDVMDAPKNTVQKALLILIQDGDTTVALHAANTSIRREDEMELDIEELAYLPLRATFQKTTGKPLFSWVGNGLGAAV